MSRHLASRFTVGLALATLVGTSAFAEDRPSNETRRGRDTIRRERAADRSEVRRSDNSTNRRSEARQIDRNRSESRSSGRDSSYRDRSRESRPQNDRSFSDRSNSNRSNNNRSNNNRSYENRSNGNRSNNNRSYDNRSNNNRSNNNRSYGNRSNNRQPYYARGRVSRIDPFRGGYRVWIGGAPYPFFIPSAYYHRNRFRIGLDIRLGGYYNPLGYYDYYDGYNDNRGYSSGELRGVVESVDYRRDTFVVRNDATGSFVTVEMRNRRRDVREGDYVEIEGEWTRSGLFRAYDVNLIEDRYRR